MPRHNTSQSTRRPRGGLPLPVGSGDVRPSKLYVVDAPIGRRCAPAAEEPVPVPSGPAPALPVAPAAPAGTGGRDREADLARWSAELAYPADLAVVAQRLDPAVRPPVLTLAQAPGLTTKERQRITNTRRVAWRVVLLQGGAAQHAPAV